LQLQLQLQLQFVVFSLLEKVNGNVNTDSAARALPGDATPLHCRGDKPGVRPGGRVTFLLRQKSNQKRRPR